MAQKQMLSENKCRLEIARRFLTTSIIRSWNNLSVRVAGTKSLTALSGT